MVIGSADPISIAASIGTIVIVGGTITGWIYRRVKKILVALRQLQEQFTPNGGATFADQVVYLRKEVRALSRRVDKMDGRYTRPLDPEELQIGEGP